MFAAAGMPVDRPANWRPTQSASASPVSSRGSSFSSIRSAWTEPDLVTNSSASSSPSSSGPSTPSNTPPKSGFRFVFGRKERKPKQKIDVDKVILTSRHAAAVQTKMMMEAHNRTKKSVKTAGITSSVHTGHLTAAQQEARHPHSGPPALHAKTDMPILTRIASGDERDVEADLERLTCVHPEWDLIRSSPSPGISQERNQSNGHTLNEPAASDSPVTASSSLNRQNTLSPSMEKTLFGSENRPLMITRNAYGTRFHRDPNGCWKR